jgi:protease secretion system membrane fusion protein
MNLGIFGFKRGAPTATPDQEEGSKPVASAVALDTDERRPLRFGYWTLIIAFGGFFAWAAFAPLDAGVTAPGVVMIDTKRKTVQHLRGGIVKALLVREGDLVTNGQPLIELDATQIKADLDIIRSQYLVRLAIEARLLAERDGKDSIEFPPDLLANAEIPQAAEAASSQAQLFETRRAALKSEVAILKESIAGLEEQLSGLTALAQSKADQLRLLNEELDSLRELAKEGYVPRNRLYEFERNVAMLSGSRSEDISNIAKTKKAIGEIKLRIIQSQQTYQREVETQLAEVQAEVTGYRERMTAAEADFERATIRAPSEGVVVGLNVHTVGGVITPADKLMDIVPRDEVMVIEAQIPVNLVDRVNPGTETDVRFTGFNRATTPILQGTVVTVSADRLTDPRSGMPYYLARISVSPEAISKLGAGKQIQPGMQADVVIKTGERTMLNYLLKPFTDRVVGAFKEE